MRRVLGGMFRRPPDSGAADTVKLASTLILITLLVAAVVGCGDDGASSEAGGEGDTAGDAGGGGETTFEAEGIDLSFRYPRDFETRDDVDFSRSAGTSASETAAVGIDDTNLIAVQRFDLQRAVTEGNFERVQREADALFSQLAGEQVEGLRRRVGGLPALEYQIALEEPPDAETRAITVFDGDAQYLINCQSTPELRDRIDQACDRALFTLEVGSQG